MPKRFPNGGMAPVSQSGESPLNSSSEASSTLCAPVAFFSRRSSTWNDAGTTAMTGFPSVFTITVLANSLPGMCVRAAIPCAVYATEWDRTMYFTLCLSRYSLKLESGIMTSLTEFHTQTPITYPDSGGFHNSANPQFAQHGLDQSFIPA